MSHAARATPARSRRYLLLAALLGLLCPVVDADQQNGDADLVLGQAGFTTAASGAGASSLNSPATETFDAAGDLWVVDYFNHRVLEFTPPFSNDQNATLVLGQPNLTSHGGNVSQTGMARPDGVALDASGNVWVSEYNNSRVTEFTPPFSNGMAAALVLGQASFTQSTANDTQASLDNPQGVAVDASGNVWVADYQNNRVVGFSPPFSDGMNATFVLGQAAFGSSSLGRSQTRMDNPAGVTADASGNIWIADLINLRVLEFSPPFADGMNAALVLGQANFSANNGAVTQATFGYPGGVALDAGGNVWVTDGLDNRVLKFAAPITNGENASLVLGQANFSASASGDTQSTLHSPGAVAFDASGDLWLVDGGNNRVLAYDLPCAQVIAGVNTIQSAVNAVLNSSPTLSGNYCIQVGPGTYPEQVNIQGINTAGYRLTLESQGSQAAVLSSPFGGVGFTVGAASVTLSGFAIVPQAGQSHVVEISAPGVMLENLVIQDPNGNVETAGVQLDGPSGGSATISYSTITVNTSGAAAVYASDSSANAIVGSYLSNTDEGDGVYFSGGGAQSISESVIETARAPNGALYFHASSSNKISASVIQDAGPGGGNGGSGGDGLVFLNGSDANSVSYTTVTTNGAEDGALYISSGTGNVISGSYVQDAAQGSVVFIDTGSFNSVSFSTVAGNSSKVWGHGVIYLADRSSSNTFTSDLLVDPDTFNPGNGGGLWISQGGVGNTMSLSFVTVSASVMGAVYLDGTYDVVSASFINDPGGGDGLYIDENASFESVSASSITTTQAGDACVNLFQTSSNTITTSFIFDDGGRPGLWVQGGGYSTGITVSSSTLMEYGGVDPALEVDTASGTFLTNLMLQNPSSGDGLYLNGASFTTLTLSTVATQSALDAAVYVNGGFSNTITQDSIDDPGGYNNNVNGSGNGVYWNATTGAVLSLSTVATNSALDAAVYVTGGSANAIAQCWIGDSGGVALGNGDGVVFESSSGNLLSLSTVATQGAYSGALALFSAPSNEVTQSALEDAGPGYCGNNNAGGSAAGILVDGADDNVISSDTITSQGSSNGALFMPSGDSNRISNSYIADGNAAAGAVIGGSFNSISQSTVAANSSWACGGAALDFNNPASSNTITDSFILDPGTLQPGNANGLSFGQGAVGNAVSRSTVATSQAASAAVYFNGSFDTVSQSYVGDTGSGDAVEFDANAQEETVSGSTITTYSARIAAVFFNASSTNTVTGSWISDPGGQAAGSGDGVRFTYDWGDAVTFSSVTTNGAADASVSVYGASGGILANLYAADAGGAPAVAVDLSYAVQLTASRLSSRPQNPGTGALYLVDDNPDFVAQGDVFSGGPQGSGIFIGSGANSYLDISSDSVTAAAYGLTFGDTAPQAAVSMLNFQNLAANATGIEFLSGAVAGSTFSSVGFDASVKTNVDASHLGLGSVLYMANATGPRAGESHADDPNHVVIFSTAAAPAPVGGLAAAVLGVSSIAWHWNTVSGVSGYDFYQPPQSAPVLVATNAYTQVGLSTNTAYVAEVLGTDQGVPGPLSAEATAFTPAVPPISPAVVAAGPAGIALQWASNGNPSYTTYQAQLWAAHGSTTTELVTGNIATFSPLAQATTYFLQVRALGLDGNLTAPVQTSTVTTPCAYVYQGVQSIQSVVDAMPATFNANVCIQVEPGAYNEQVTISGFNTAGFRFTLQSDGPQAAVVSPPGSSNAAFIVQSASVTLQGFAVAPQNSQTYGIWISSLNATMSDILLQDSGQYINGAGVELDGPLGSFATISNSTVSVDNSAAYALYASGSNNDRIIDSYLISSNGGDGAWFNGGSFESIAQSTIATVDAMDAALYFQDVQGSTITGSFLQDAGPGGAITCAVGSGAPAETGGTGNAGGLVFDGGGGSVLSFSTVTTNGAYIAAVFLSDGSSSNSMTNDSIAEGAYGDVVELSGADSNSIANSSLSGNSTWGCDLGVLEVNGTGNKVSGAFISDPDKLWPGNGDGVYFDPGSGFNSVQNSTVAVSQAYNGAIYFVAGSTGNAVTGSYVSDAGGTGAVYIDFNGIQSGAGAGASNLSTVISSSTIVETGTKPAMTLIGDASTTLSGLTVINPSGGDAGYFSGSSFDAVLQSTFVSVAATDAALYFLNVQGSMITDSHIQDIGPGGCDGGNGNGNGLVFDGSNGNGLSFSTVTTNAAGNAALFLMDGSSSDSIRGDSITDLAYSDAVELGSDSDFNSISQSALTGSSSWVCDGGVLEIGGSWNTVSGTSISDSGPAGSFSSNGIFFDPGPGVSFNLIQNSVVTTTASALGAIYFFGGDSSNTVAGIQVDDYGGNGALYVDYNGDLFGYPAGGANIGLSITSGTFFETAPVPAMTWVDDASSTLSGISAGNPAGGDGAYFNGSSFDLISQSTFSTVDAVDGALYFQNVQGSTITASVIQDLGPGGCNGGDQNADGLVFNGSSGDSLALSAVTANGAYNAALYLWNGSSSNTITNDALADRGSGEVVQIDPASDFNSISQSALAGNSATCNNGVLEIAGSSNTVSGASISDPDTLFPPGDGGGVFFREGGDFNQLLNSTVTVSESASAAVYFYADNSSNVVTGSFISDANGGGAVFFLVDSGNVVSSSTIVESTDSAATQSLSPAVAMSGASGAALIGDSISESPGGIGLQVQTGDSGLSLLSDVFSGAGIGAQFQAAVPGLSISTLTFHSLTAGATAMQFLSGAWDSTFTYVAFADAVNLRETNVDASQIASGNWLQMLNSSGPLGGPGGAAYDDDPHGVVHFLTVVVPPAPAGLAGAALGTSSVTWTWNAVANTTGYEFYFSTGTSFELGATTFTQTGLSTNTAYGAQVQALDLQLPGSLTATVTAYTLAAPATGLAFLSETGGAVNLQWGANTNPAGTRYRLDYWTPGSTTSLTVVTTTASVSGLAAGTTYTFQVVAENGAGVFAAPSATIPVLTAPPAPAGLAGTALGTSSITWTWNAASGASSYKLYPSTGGPAIPVPGLAFTQTTLLTNTAYGAEVSALSAAGESALSATVTAYTLAAPPTGFALVAVNITSATFSWGAGGDPNGTEFQLTATPVVGVAPPATTGTGTTLTMTNLAGGTTYTVSLAALNGGGIPAPSTTTVMIVTNPVIQAVATVSSTGTTVVTFNPTQGPVVITVPPGAFSSSVVMTVTAPGSYPAAVSPDAALTATGVGIQILLNQLGAQPQQPVTLSISYAGTNFSQFNPADLVIARFDPTDGIWVPLPSTPDTTDQRVVAVTSHFSLFQIMAVGAAGSVSDPKVFPNPFRPALGHTSITFSNLPANTSLKIYTLIGEKVQELETNSSGMASWDARNSHGEHVASGVYFVEAKGTGGTNIFKVIIQR